MDLEQFHRLTTDLPGVRRTSSRGSARWELQGRLVARVLDESHVVIRVPFDVRDVLLEQHPTVFSVPTRYARHMLVVADLAAGDGPIEEALQSTWQLQSRGQGAGGRPSHRS